jgi:hypothetical protein
MGAGPCRRCSVRVMNWTMGSSVISTNKIKPDMAHHKLLLQTLVTNSNRAY